VPLKAYGSFVEIFAITFSINNSGANITKTAFLSCLSEC
jgi:hypothetical protein